jgi:methionyl-tRNA formyltransferase
MNSRFRIVFMGTPDFAVPALSALVADGFDVAAVVTAPDKPAGRGQQMQQSAVKKFAQDHGLTILQPEKLKNPDFIAELRALQADLFVVVAFRMLPEVVWAMPPRGTINLHGSLLPNYRGAAPIHRAVMNGEKETGVTTFFLQHEIDTGEIIAREKLSIGPEETTGQLHDRMMIAGAHTLLATVRSIANGTATSMAQIAFETPTNDVYNHVRGLSPYPTAYTKINGKTIKIFFGKIRKQAPTKMPGEWIIENAQTLAFVCSDGYFLPTDVQLEGKKRMSIEEFLRGFNPSPSTPL